MTGTNMNYHQTPRKLSFTGVPVILPHRNPATICPQFQGVLPPRGPTTKQSTTLTRTRHAPVARTDLCLRSKFVEHA